MAKLSTASRSKLSSKSFGMPKSRKYPMPDRSHAANAKARATQMVEKGKLSPSSAAKIKAKANKILGEKEMKHKSEKKHHVEKKHHTKKHETHKSEHHHAMKTHHEHMKKLEHEIHEKHKEHKKARDHMHKLAKKAYK
jgi:hypothetical protein